MRPAIPRHNGKVERSHREDQKRLYNKTTFYSLDDAHKQLKKYLKKSNRRPMRPLGFLSFIQVISNLLNVYHIIDSPTISNSLFFLKHY